MKTIELKGSTVNYTIRRHKRAKRLRLTINRQREVILTLPRGVSEAAGRRFIREKADWIRRILDRMKNKKSIPAGDGDYKKDKEKARALVKNKLEYYNQFYRFEINRISIRNQKSRWGSCSARGNLNFSFKLLYIPDDLADYIIVHELCHLGEMNHSARFWALVERAVPDYKSRKSRLRGL